VTRKWYWDAELPQPKIHEGALVFGLQVEGARWDFNACCLEESEPKKQFSAVPVVWCKAQELSKKKENDPSIFDCPMYLTPTRGKTYVNKAQMKTKMHPNKWILAGVSIILDVEGFSDQYRPGFDPTK
jgi:dynein heavy chain